MSAVALLTAAAGIVVWAAALRLRRGAWEGAKAALALWTAAGLLRLATASSWNAIGAAAAIVVVRHVVQLGIGARPRAA